MQRRSRFMASAIRFAAIALAMAFSAAAIAQQAASRSPDRPPRLVEGVEAGSAALRERIARDATAARLFEAIKSRVQPYVERHRQDPAWIVSRLQMYWQSHYTRVYVKNGLYDHAEGRAPVPTVRFTGARDAVTAYGVPNLEDVKPYMGEGDRLYLQNRNAPGQPWEWVPQPKTGRVVEAINMRIAELARDAAFLYWYTGDESCAKFAFDIVDTYMTGIHYREMPIDISHGHDQTLVGLQSFEVIHEDIVGPLAESYDFIHGYIARHAPDKQALYDAAFKKWADVIIANGVPWNNWNLIQARFVLQIAAVLDADERYPDKRGSRHYVQAAIEGSGPRQWALRRLADYGYDRETAMWNESPGYSINVAGDYMECIEILDRVFGIDLLPRMPVLPRAIVALPQYLLPNGRTVGFGDTHYERLRTAALERLLGHAQRHNRQAEAQQYAALLAAIRADAGDVAAGVKPSDNLHALLGRMEAGHAAGDVPSDVAGRITAAPRIQAYQTPTFFAPNVSWLIQRNGYDRGNARNDALVISQAGSSGNHAHANGIAMELYAKGLSLAPESGRGSGYFQNDYAEYYAQFPAHNTVVVDGISTYPPMKSNHPLFVDAVYPPPGSPASEAFPLATFSDVSFREPESDAEQRRVLGTVRLDDGHGYFVDIFRSRRRDGKDKYHDYLYHNLGQAMRFMTPDGKPLPTAASQALAFADGDLIGYDYWGDRKSLTSDKPLKARFDLALPERAVSMNVWLQGAGTREFFSVQAPPSTSWSAGMLPQGLDRMPMQTLVIRQRGEAWSRPFTAIMEAEEGSIAGSVLAVEEIVPEDAAGHAIGLRVTTAGQRSQTIMSNDGDSIVFAHGGLRLVGRYGIVAGRNDGLDYLLLGCGREVAGRGYAIAAQQHDASVALWQEQGRWFYAGNRPAQLRVPVSAWPRELELPEGGRVTRIAGRIITVDGRLMRAFDMPPMTKRSLW